PLPDLCVLVEAAPDGGHPPGPQFDDADAEVSVALEDAIEHKHADEALDRVVEADHVLAPDVLAAAEPVGRDGPPGVHPVRAELDGRATDVKERGQAGLGQA